MRVADGQRHVAPESDMAAGYDAAVVGRAVPARQGDCSGHQHRCRRRHRAVGNESILCRRDQSEHERQQLPRADADDWHQHGVRRLVVHGLFSAGWTALLDWQRRADHRGDNEHWRWAGVADDYRSIGHGASVRARRRGRGPVGGGRGGHDELAGGCLRHHQRRGAWGDGAATVMGGDGHCLQLSLRRKHYNSHGGVRAVPSRYR